MEPLKNDFNTPQALTFLFASLREGNVKLAKGDAAGAKACADQLLRSGRFLGLFDSLGSSGDPSKCPEVEEILRLRAEARKRKLFAVSDRIRDELAKLGLRIEDGKDGSRVLGMKQDADLSIHTADFNKLIREISTEVR